MRQHLIIHYSVIYVDWSFDLRFRNMQHSFGPMCMLSKLFKLLSICCIILCMQSHLLKQHIQISFYERIRVLIISIYFTHNINKYCFCNLFLNMCCSAWSSFQFVLFWSLVTHIRGLGRGYWIINLSHYEILTTITLGLSSQLLEFLR